MIALMQKFLCFMLKSNRMIIVEWFRLYHMLTLKTRLYDTIIYINKCL